MNLRIIILCAGIGERMQPLTYKTNKSLVLINGKPLLCHFLDTLHHALVNAQYDPVATVVHVIIGHYGYLFRDLIGSTYQGMSIRYHENPLYAITGAAQSLYLVKDVLQHHPCLIVEGDHYLHPQLVSWLLSSPYENALLVDPSFHPLTGTEEVVAYVTHQSELLGALQWPGPFDPELSLGEVPTLFKLSKEACNAYSIILEHYLMEPGPAKRELIEPFNRLLRFHAVQWISTAGLPWIEIDTAADLQRAQELSFQ